MMEFTQEIKEQFLNLVPGIKYTLASYGEFGFMYSIQFKLHSVEIKPYAQYKESFLVYFTKKGCRTVKGIRFLPYQDVVIWEGWQAVNTEMYTTSETNSAGMTMRKSLLCFSPEYLKIALDSVAQKPILFYSGKDIMRQASCGGDLI